MKKIVRGNDFTLRIPVKKIVNGEQVSFPLTDCTDIAVHVVSKYKRTALPTPSTRSLMMCSWLTLTAQHCR